MQMQMDLLDQHQQLLERPHPNRRRMFWNLALIAGALFLGQQIVNGGPLLRIAAALAVVGAFAIPAIENPKRAMYMLFCWLPFLGIVRRVLVPATGLSSYDPLLLVSSAVVLLIFITLVATGKAELGGTSLSRMVFYLLLIGGIQVFNPTQGSILVGLTGVMFVLVPMMCFFIGRSVADEEMVWKLQRVMIFAGVVAAAYGAYQVLVGFPGFEKAYLAKAGFGGLYVGSAIRPMSTFTNPLEYSTYLAGALITALSVLLYKRGVGKWWLAGVIGFMGWSGYKIGSRGFVVTAIVAAIALFGLRAKSMFSTLLVMAAMIGGIVFYTSTHSGSNVKADATQSAAAQLEARNKTALLDPFDEKRSTLRQHYRGIKQGLIYAFTKQPFGMGTGATGRGNRKFGGDNKSNSTELDISDAAIAFGVLGGLLYMGIIALSLLQGARLRRMIPGYVWPAVLGFSIVSLGQWLNGGNYAVAPLIWFMLGAADAAFMRARREKRAQQASLGPHPA